MVIRGQALQKGKYDAPPVVDRFKGLAGSQHTLNSMVAAFGLTRKANRNNSSLLFC